MSRCAVVGLAPSNSIRGAGTPHMGLSKDPQKSTAQSFDQNGAGYRFWNVCDIVGMWYEEWMRWPSNL
ncbi:uncharacterized protein EI90DRAFT_3060533 [Cantharellus anzutake]|uniref:uncharacterized protein n=1 Tax=Cantharellus anzutake TaxID=1750568 RepID=UPI001908D22F|nr:uncharacterized protein EI90DRAFT_3060533 [Cantharellus anzutake]KAF8330381.1 hypothetical protein EI90DRAFT_3060533 [Cantharellus anzutake]